MTGPNLRAASWDVLWSWTHRVLLLNLALVAVNLPLLLALAAVDRPWRYPAFFGVLSVGLGPSVAAAFGWLARAEDDQPPRLRDYILDFRRLCRRAGTLWAATVAAVGVLVTDIAVLLDSPAGALAIPPLAVLTVLTLATGLLALAVTALWPSLSLVSTARLALWASVRSWPLTLLTAVVLVAGLVVVNQAPLLGLATVPGCALVVAWTNCRLALDRAVSGRALP